MADSAVVQASWWAERRFGISIEASLASVPSWAPLGADPHHYAEHLSGSGSDASPLPEVLAHHRDRWGHVEHYRDFAKLLTFDKFDAERWAELVRAAGAGFAIATGQHHDGWTWWDAPSSEHRLTECGPKRNIIAELAAAFERNAIPLAASLSLASVGPSRAEIDTVHAQAADLVSRLGVLGLWASDATGPPDAWRGTELLERLRAIERGVVLNDGWFAPLADSTDSSPIVATHVGHLPESPSEHPWEFVCGLGRTLGHNRAETTADLLDAADIIDRYTGVLARGGHFRLSIGADADGNISDDIAERLVTAGDWIRRLAPSIEPCRPWATWGNDSVRYLDDGGDVIVIDLHGNASFAALGAGRTPVLNVDIIDAARPPSDVKPIWTQTDEGLTIAQQPGSTSPTTPIVYRVTLGEPSERITLFHLDPPEPTPLAPLVASSSPGDIVQLGEGDYVGPARVPVGVVLRGLGVGRTRIVSPVTEDMAPPQPVITLTHHARLEHITVRGNMSRTSGRQPALVRVEAPFATLLGCEVTGSIDVIADGAIIRATQAKSVTSTGADRLLVSRCTFSGEHADQAVSISGGSDHEIESSRIEGHRNGIVLNRAVGCVVRGNLIHASECGVQALNSERLHVHGNQVRNTMRAVDIDGGSDALIDGNSVSHSDSGCLVRGGAAGVTAAGNHWHACRAGLITWSADPHHRDNVCVELLDPDAALVRGP